MITYTKGNIFKSNCQALINPVNTYGVMGKGLALEFKKEFPENYKIYRQSCQDGKLQIGQLLKISEDNSKYGQKIIINFPTKKHWKNSSEYSYIRQGLEKLKSSLEDSNSTIQSVAIPPLGCGNGGLRWDQVKKLIESYLKDLSVYFEVYEP